jgi:hypothetical protein
MKVIECIENSSSGWVRALDEIPLRGSRATHLRWANEFHENPEAHCPVIRVERIDAKGR